MKKIITTIAFIALSTVSVKAVGPSLGMFSVTAGLAANQGVFGASATETTENGAGVVYQKKTEHGVFTDGYTSQFVELGIGNWVSLGCEHTPDSITTPTNTTRQNDVNGQKANVSVDFNDMNTKYVKLNLPYFTGMYIKAGSVETDLDIKEVMGSGSTYANKSTSGSMMGLGYSKFIKETGFGFRVETSYLELDNVTTNNGIAKGTVNAAVGSVNHNEVAAKNLEGLQAKIALTYTFGKN